MEKYRRLKCTSELGVTDNNNCSVMAVALTCNVDYDTAYDALEKQGRKRGHGLMSHKIHDAIIGLNKTLTEIRVEVEYINGRKGTISVRQENGMRYTPKSIIRDFAEGNYICHVDGHCFALIDGVVEDWTKNRCHRITSMYKVE